eukprot:jgi/Ulvmu1/7929/UM004_0161.1
MEHPTAHAGCTALPCSLRTLLEIFEPPFCECAVFYDRIPSLPPKSPTDFHHPGHHRADWTWVGVPASASCLCSASALACQSQKKLDLIAACCPCADPRLILRCNGRVAQLRSCHIIDVTHPLENHSVIAYSCLESFKP